jgi:hypothetical protein
MTRLLLSTVVIALATTAGAQKEENMPTQITTIEVASVKARYLNFKWDEEAFEALEKGGAMPGAKRSWAIARLYPEKPIMLDGKRISGGNLLVLNPARGDSPMTLEVRVIDMRDLFVNVNVVAEPPPGRKLFEEPARFEKVDSVTERLTLALREGDKTIELSIHYGDRRATLTFER